MHRALGSVPSTTERREKINGRGRKEKTPPISRDCVHQLCPVQAEFPRLHSKQVQTELRNEPGFPTAFPRFPVYKELWLNHSPQPYRLVTHKRQLAFEGLRVSFLNDVFGSSVAVSENSLAPPPGKQVGCFPVPLSKQQKTKGFEMTQKVS